jgi:hypothetical protein
MTTTHYIIMLVALQVADLLTGGIPFIAFSLTYQI